MNNQNGYNYNGVVPNNQGQSNNVMQPQVPVQNNYSQNQQPVIQAQTSYVPQPSNQVSQPVMQAQATMNNNSSVQQPAIVTASPSYPQKPTVQPSYAQQSEPVVAAQTSYPQTQTTQASPQTGYAQQSQVINTQPISYAQQTPTISTPPVANNPVPTNPIIDLNPKPQVMPIEQTINQDITQPNYSENSNIFVPETNSTEENNQDKKSKIKLPSLSKKQLIIVGVALAVILIVIISIVVSKNSSSGNNGNNNSNNTSNTSNIVSDDSYKDLPIDDWQSYKFKINNKELSLPISYSALSSISGFTMKTKYKEQELDKNNYMSVNLYKSKRLSLYTEIYNGGSDNVALQDGTITRIGQTYDQVKNGAEAVIFPANLKVGMEMTQDSLIEILGDPSNIKNYSSDNYVNNSYIYYAASDRTSVNYYEVTIVNDIIEQITLDHRG